MDIGNSLRRVMVMVGCVAAISLVSSRAAFAQEHPEHPEESKHAEHPEHPTGDKAEITKDAMAASIEAYVGSDAELKGGYFFVYDDAASEVLWLTLDLVHRERVSMVGENLYFACADLTTKDGKTYDLDFFMEADDDGELMVTDIMVHKEAGEPRYTWSEKDGIWVRNEVD